jgi:hypothetical protein
MGLDITAYSHLRHLGHHPGSDVDDHEYDPETYDVRHVEAYSYTDFPHALMGIPHQRPMDGYSGSKFVSAGCFEITDKTETYRFRAGSYGGYNRWRADLREHYNSDLRPEGWFYELIWFADNEGTLCQPASAKLLDHFRRFEVEYAARHDDYDTACYRDWLRAFELAADGGLVDFH